MHLLKKRRRDGDRDVCATPERRVRSRSVYKYDTSDKGRVVMRYDDRSVIGCRAGRPTVRTMTLNENMNSPTVVTSSTAGLHQTSSVVMIKIPILRFTIYVNSAGH